MGRQRSGDEHITFESMPIGYLLSDYWAWDLITSYADEVKRQSDVYVFCHYTATERSKADPLILDNWDLYILRTRTLNEICGGQKTLSLRSLQRLDPIEAKYSGIKNTIIYSVSSCFHKFAVFV